MASMDTSHQARFVEAWRSHRSYLLDMAFGMLGNIAAAEHQLVVEQFICSCANGDLAGLLEILDPAVWGDVDLGPPDRRSGQVRRGAPAVATNVFRFLRGMTMVSNPIGAHTIVLLFVEQKLSAIVLLTVERMIIRQSHVLADPEKLLPLDLQLGGSHSTGSD